MVAFWIVLGVIVAERLVELRLARSNHARLIESGGREYGQEHYAWIVALHAGFFVSLVLERLIRHPSLPPYWSIFAVAFGIAQMLRIWVLTTLGDRWTTRVIVVPREELVASGPYRLIRHPNYAVVAVELLSVPMIFGLYWTGLIFTVLNGILLLVIRIPLEERVLRRYAAHLPRSQ